MARRLRRLLVLAGSAVALAACVSLDGLSGGRAELIQGPGVDGSIDGDEEEPIDEYDGSGYEAPDGPDGPLTRANAYRDAILADGPLAYWRFEETTGTAAADETGTHPGVYKQSPTLGSPGVFAGTFAIELPDKSRSHVEVAGDVFAFPQLASYSVELWVKPKTFVSYYWVVASETSPPRSGWSLFVGANAEPQFEVWRPNDGGQAEVRTLSTKKALVADRFQHVVVTYNGAVSKGFLDGALTGSGPGSKDAPDGSGFSIGCRRLNNGTVDGCVDGWSIDEVAMYDYPLTDAQVLAHFELGKP